MIFKTSVLDYGPCLEGATVFARVSDFEKGRGRTKKIATAIREFHDGGDFGVLADYLPCDLAKLPREQLRVCEAAVQYDFMQTMFPGRCFPSMSPLAYADGCIEVTEKTRSQPPQVFKMGEFFKGHECGWLFAA